MAASSAANEVAAPAVYPCPTCGAPIKEVEMSAHFETAHPRPSPPSPKRSPKEQEQKFVDCPICCNNIKLDHINAHIDDGECTGPEAPVAPVAFRGDTGSSTPSTTSRMRRRPGRACRQSSSSSSRAAFGTVSPIASFSPGGSLLDQNRHQRRRDMDISRKSLFSPAQIKDMTQNEFKKGSDSFDYLLHAMHDDEEVDRSFLFMIRSFIQQNICIPPEVIARLLFWIESDTVPYRDAQEVFVCFREMLSIHSSIWIPLNTDWAQFSSLIAMICAPQVFMDSVLAHRTSRTENMNADQQRDSQLTLVEPSEMLLKKMMLLRLFLGAFTADIASRKSSGKDLASEGVLRSLIDMSTMESGLESSQTARELYCKCEMAQFIIHDQHNLPEHLVWECVFLAEAFQHILIASFPDISLNS